MSIPRPLVQYSGMHLKYTHVIITPYNADSLSAIFPGTHHAVLLYTYKALKYRMIEVVWKYSHHSALEKYEEFVEFEEFVTYFSYDLVVQPRISLF